MWMTIKKRKPVRMAALWPYVPAILWPLTLSKVFAADWNHLFRCSIGWQINCSNKVVQIDSVELYILNLQGLNYVVKTFREYCALFVVL